MTTYRCAKCGKDLELPDGAQSGFCVQCGSAFTLPAPDPKAESMLSGIESSDPLLRRAAMFLEEGNWILAHQYCENVLDREPENAQAYLCELLAVTQHPSLNRLFSAYAAQYAEPVYETLYACDEVTSHINSVVAASEVPGYLSGDRIASLYFFDRSYASALSCRKQQRTAQQAQLAQIRPLNRALQFAAGDLKEMLESRMKALNDTLDKRVASAEAEDKANVMRIRQAYLEHISEADKATADMKRSAEQERDNYYQYCADLVNTARTENEFINAYNSLSPLGNYRDTTELCLKCQSQIARFREERAIANSAARKKSMKKLRKILIIVCSILVVCAALAIVTYKVLLPMWHYKNAVSLLKSAKYDKAISEFEDLDGYKDSDERITECMKAKAAKLLKDEKYEEAYEVYEELGDTRAILVSKCNRAADLLEDGFEYSGYSLLEEMGISYLSKEVQYETVDSLVENGRAQTAFLILRGLNYTDTKEKRAELVAQYPEVLLVGEVVEFGSIEQDNNTYNGKEPIEWVVVDKQDGKVLLVSKNILDCKPYSAAGNPAWSSSDLRKRLNDTFLVQAFTEEEQALILTSEIAADKNPKQHTDPGSDTQDKVFILSLSEIEDYFPGETDSICYLTQWAKNTALKTRTSRSSHWYWVRTPGTESKTCFISHTGAVNYGGNGSDAAEGGVRPAMWLGSGS
ncbi:MAG: DUF6273 domain-containing protein [Clostridia bacterium]|nr:DUF6273 domain-containing protein [Clostridia bacterium]